MKRYFRYKGLTVNRFGLQISSSDEKEIIKKELRSGNIININILITILKIQHQKI